jgi:sarcosine oxidase gamma subunit
VPRLVHETPVAGLALPIEIGAARLVAGVAQPLWSITPFRGREAEVAAGLGAEALAVGREVAAGEGRLVWAGIGLWLLRGISPPDGLDAIAGVAEQTDGFAVLELQGRAAVDVLARLVPLDLAGEFAPGLAARSLLFHVPLLIVGQRSGFEMLVPRSYAATAVHDLVEAMRGVAARGLLP